MAATTVNADAVLGLTPSQREVLAAFDLNEQHEIGIVTVCGGLSASCASRVPLAGHGEFSI